MSLHLRLTRQISALDEDALAALASRGLLRRARKDLEGGLAVELAAAEETAVVVRVGDRTVTFRASGPASARCSCPAGAGCQHILAACLRFPNTGSGEISVESTVRAEFCALEQAAAERWAGAAGWRAAFELAAHAVVESESAEVAVVRLADGALCRLLRGAGLEGALAKGSPAEMRRAVAAAAIALRAAAGQPWTEPPPETLAKTDAGAPRSRADVLAAAQAALESAVAGGLTRLPESLEGQLTTLALSATGVHLPRLAFALRRLATAARALRLGQGSGGLEGLLDQLARTWTLAEALRRAGPQTPLALAGESRSQYREAGTVELRGAAVWPWETASGYRGLTLLLWEPRRRRWHTWSDARPRQIDAFFDPLARADQAGPWPGLVSPRQAAEAHFRLLRARGNAAGRLATGAEAQAELVPPLPDFEVVRDWRELPRLAAAARAHGLREPLAEGAYAVLEPDRWGSRHFELTTQTFSWWLTDRQGAMLPLSVPPGPHTAAAIQRLKALPAPAAGSRMVVQLERSGSILPRTLLPPTGPAQHLWLAPLGATPTPPAPPPGPAAEEDPGPEPEPPAPLSAPARLLAAALDPLLAAAESGRLHPRQREELLSLSGRVDRLDWTLLASVLREISQTGPREMPAALLRGVYLGRLFSESLELAEESQEAPAAPSISHRRG